MEKVTAGLRGSLFYNYCSAIGAYHCPGDMRTKNLRPGQGWAYDSYIKMDSMGGNWVPDLEFKKMSDIKEPVNSFVFKEAADQRGCNWSTFKMDINWAAVRAGATTIRPRWGDPPTVFHGDIDCSAFADGHVESRAWKEATTLVVARGMAAGKWPEQDIIITKDVGDNDRDLRYMYSKYRYKRYIPWQ